MDFLHFNVLVTQASGRDLERDGTTLLTVKTPPRSELDLSPKIDQLLLLILKRFLECFHHFVSFRAADDGLLEILELKDLVRHLVIDPPVDLCFV